MTIPTSGPLPESISDALGIAATQLTDATPADVPSLLFDLREEWLEAVQDGLQVDGFAILDALPHLSDPAVEAAVNEFIGEIWDDAIRAMPILLTFAEAKPPRVLSGLRALSFEEGKAGKRFDDWQHDASIALCEALRLPEGSIPPAYDLIMGALEEGFEDGRLAAGIFDDPPLHVHPVMQARIAAAREAVAERLENATDLDALADEIKAEFKIQSGDTWLAVEEISRAAAVDGSLHAARLRRAQILGVHRWVIAEAAEVAARRELPDYLVIMRNRSRTILREMGA